MPSLSKTVFCNGWMTISSWVVYLGFTVVAISLPADANPATDVETAGFAELASSISPDAKATQDTPASSSELNRLARSESVPPDSAVNQTAAEAPLPHQPGAVSGEVAAQSTEASDRVGQAMPESQTIAPIMVSSEECLADCNPTEQFDFNPPVPDIAIPPRSAYPRPDVARTPLPVPTYPRGTAGEVPPPPPISSPATPGVTPSRETPEPAVPPVAQTPPTESQTAAELADTESRRALTPPSLQLQGVYLFQGDEDSARLRVTGVYPILPELQVGGSLDFTEGEIFSESGDDGLEVNELYLAASVPNYPNLRLIVGQIDLTSYFDRNSFAKDSAQQFFNPVFATNPALSAAGLGSRQGAVVNWTIIDEVEAKAAVFSSDRSISDFELNAFAGEIGARLGNLIVRGTYVTAEDAGANTGFEEIFQLQRRNGEFGPRDGDREDAYGLNAEFFIPEINLGLFARYGWYENRDLDRGGTTYSFGINLLDLFMEDDRLGLGYGRLLSNNDLRDGDNPDVFEAFYDFRILPWLRLGVTFQGLDEFSETIAGFRIRTDFDLVPPRRTR
ncbi:porin [Leptolyngbya sp. NK1-12]|uniref:Porin n=2 Tax=Leptolyngbya sp. NK1-12 TaxID=2547451 RepID=A0AA96WCU8_9CYAN|nr:porin [Leptolyngbya sp. NK1-12]